jgi:hypothetical protein
MPVIKHLFKSDRKLHSMVLSLEGPKKKEMSLLQQSAVKREFSRWSSSWSGETELGIGALHTRTELRQRERTHLYK